MNRFSVISNSTAATSAPSHICRQYVLVFGTYLYNTKNTANMSANELAYRMRELVPVIRKSGMGSLALTKRSDAPRNMLMEVDVRNSSPVASAISI